MSVVPEEPKEKLPDAFQVVFLTGQINLGDPAPEPGMPYTLELTLQPPALDVGWILMHGGSEVLRIRGSSPTYLREVVTQIMGIPPEKTGRFLRMTIEGPPAGGFTGILRVTKASRVN